MREANDTALENLGSRPETGEGLDWGDTKGRTPREKRRIRDLCASFFLVRPCVGPNWAESTDLREVTAPGVGSGGAHTLTRRAYGTLPGRDDPAGHKAPRCHPD